jgi:hypothetical protein
MVEALALCLEDLDTAEGDCRYVQCVALAGRGPGLRVDRNARPLWNSEQDVAFVLCVSADERLVLLRPEETDNVTITVRRAGRSVVAHAGKPIVLLDKDRIQVCDRSLRVYLHGPAGEIHEPRELAPRPARWRLRTAAATLALGAALGAASGNAAGQSPRPMRGQDAGNTGGAADAGTDNDASEDGPDAPIEVREAPPVIESGPRPIDPGPPAAGCWARTPGQT